MKSIRVGINGFGRIGRTLFRVLQTREDVQVVAINDVTDSEVLSHLLKYDSVHGVLDAEISATKDSICVNDAIIRYTQESSLDKLNWNNCDIVIEATGKHLTKEALFKHQLAGAAKVILTAPPEGEGIKMVVLGVNEHVLDHSDTIISNASCTTNSAAPLVQLIEQNFGVEQAYITTVHSYTKDQSLHDSPHKDLRRARAGALSIIPTTTGAAKALTKIFPHLEIGGCGMRVPVSNGSLTDMTFIVQKDCTIEEVNKVFFEASQSSHKGYVSYTQDPIVSVDVLGNPASCLYDAQLTSVLGKMVKVVAWYDNEMGYSNRLADLILKIT